MNAIVMLVLMAAPPTLPDAVTAAVVPNEFSKLPAEPVLVNLGPFTLKKVDARVWRGSRGNVDLELRDEGVIYSLTVRIDGRIYHSNTTLDFKGPGGRPRFHLSQGGTQAMMAVGP